jgi:prophage antirepressor-like protein
MEKTVFGKGHSFNDLPKEEIRERALDMVMKYHEAKNEDWIRHIDPHWAFGWTTFVYWHYRNRLLKHGIDVTREYLNEMLDGLVVGEDMLPLSAQANEKEEVEVPKSKALQVFTFNKKQVRVVMKDGEPWWVAKDVCDILELTNPREAIKPLDDDEKGSVRISDGTSPKGGNPNVNVINESGVYALIIRSNKPEAKRFRKFVTSEVLPAIRKTGEYATPEAQRRKADKDDELIRKRLDIMERNADYRMAKLILQGIEKFQDVMTPESKTVFMTKYGELTTKHDMTHMLPAATEKWYTATDLAKEFNTSAQNIGLISNANNLKAPEGQSNEYGTWIRSKSPHSSKEVMAWVYYEAGRAWLAEYFSKQVKTA